MQKRLIGLLVLCATLALSASAALSDPKIAASWKTVDVKWRISGNALTGQSAADISNGYLDSLKIYNGGLADLDTSTVIDLRDQAIAVDSLQFIRVNVIGDNAFASGESLYVEFDAADFAGAAFRDLGLATCGTCGPGGYGAAGSLVPGTARAISRMFSGAGSATAVNVAMGLGPAGPGRTGTVIYGNFGGFPYLRLRFHSDYAVVPVVNLIRVQLEYLSTDSKSQ